LKQRYSEDRETLAVEAVELQVEVEEKRKDLISQQEVKIFIYEVFLNQLISAGPSKHHYRPPGKAAR